MRQLLLAAGAVCAAVATAGTAAAQPNAMPGQVVGTGVPYTLNPVGHQIQKTTPAAGKPINIPQDSPLMRPYDPSKPYDAFKGTNLSASQLAAPIPNFGDQSTLGQYYDKLKSILGFKQPSVPTRSTYFPSLTRRNRERHEAMTWRRD